MTINEGTVERRPGEIQAPCVPDRVERFLADLPPGSRATVLQVVSAGAAATARRLGDLGFTPGAVVDVVRRAPLRDPVVYRVKDYEICLRRAQAASILVVAVPA